MRCSSTSTWNRWRSTTGLSTESVLSRWCDTSPDRESANAIGAIGADYDRVIEHLLSLSVTVIHGKFSVSLRDMR